MQIKRFVVLCICIVLLASCSPYNGGGELTGTRKAKKWFEPIPYGMVLIPTGNLIIGQNDQDISWTITATQKSVSVGAFYMDETEITNDEYRQFVFWVIDSIKRQRLADAGFEEFFKQDKQGVVLEPPVLNKSTRIDTRNEEYREALESLEYTGDNRIQAGEVDVRKLIYSYKWYDLEQAAQNARFLNAEGEYTGGFVINAYGEREPIKGRSSFILHKQVPVYPDTLCWLKDFTYAYNEPYAREYFSHPGYDNYPVVGVNWHQAQAFCHWRTSLWHEHNAIRVDKWRLPTETEWEYAARGGLIGQKYPWGGPYIPTKKGCYVANFKPKRGNYIADGGSITVPVGYYEPNGYGLYDMAGNVAEWTIDSYNESAYEVFNDMNPYYQTVPRESDNPIHKRKVIRGGSWKDIAYYLQNGVKSSEHQDSTRSYIGFRTVRTLIEFN